MIFQRWGIQYKRMIKTGWRLARARAVIVINCYVLGTWSFLVWFSRALLEPKVFPQVLHWKLAWGDTTVGWEKVLSTGLGWSESLWGGCCEDKLSWDGLNFDKISDRFWLKQLKFSFNFCSILFCFCKTLFVTSSVALFTVFSQMVLKASILDANSF